MSNPWDKPEEKERKPQPRFGQLDIEYQEKTNKNGGTYFEYTLNIFPVADGQNPAKRDFSFTKTWLHITHPSFYKLVEDGKVQNVSQFFDGKNLLWVKYQWTEHRSYESRDIARNKTNYPEGNKKDADGIIYASMRGIEFLDVFPDEDACLAAHDAHYGIENGAVGTTDDIPGFEEKKPKIEPVDEMAALAFVDGLKDSLKPIFAKVIGENNKVDLEKAKELLTNELPMMANLPLEHDKVQILIKEVEATLPW